MKAIPLTQGHVTLVDDEDYEFLMQWKWHALKGGSGVYAHRNAKPRGKKTIHVMMHRVINNTPPGMDTDHINGNTLDNRRCNLRSATRSQNMQNRKPNIKGASKYKGVSWHKQHRKWVAAIQVGKRRCHIGLYEKETDAAKAYAEQAAIFFGHFNREISHV